VPLPPKRILDTRRGLGAPTGRIGARSHIDLVVAGRAGVPKQGVVAVVLNVTGTGALGPTFLTAYAAGRALPGTSSLNLRPGTTTPNLVVAEVGEAGAVRLYNDAAPVHCIADVAGYFTSTAAAGLVTLPARRAIDTRHGTGLSAGKLAAGREASIKLAGLGGVPANAASVVVNVTGTGASEPTFVSVWPDGLARPDVSTLNVVPGQAVANLAVVPVGEGGRIRFYNDRGALHLVVDVLACFTPEGPGGYVPVRPQRLLDTRIGLGAPKAKVGRSPVVVAVGGRAGVPISGARAVLATVTVTGASQPTFVTAWPGGSSRPSTSNVNVIPGQAVSNTVLVPLGPDGTVLLTHDAGEAHLLLDVLGWFTV
jgi:hypothetical protein